MPKELKQISCTVEIRYNPTGEIRSVQQTMHYLDEPSCFIWEEGNYACDCNRALFFHDFNAEGDAQECDDKLYAVRITDNRTRKVVYDEFSFSD